MLRNDLGMISNSDKNRKCGSYERVSECVANSPDSVLLHESWKVFKTWDLTWCLATWFSDTFGQVVMGAETDLERLIFSQITQIFTHTHTQSTLRATKTRLVSFLPNTLQRELFERLWKTHIHVLHLMTFSFSLTSWLTKKSCMDQLHESLIPINCTIINFYLIVFD